MNAELGFKVIHCDELEEQGPDHVARRIRDRVGDAPPLPVHSISTCSTRAHAPGTGTPEVAGLTSRELVNILRGTTGAQNGRRGFGGSGPGL